jgi:hypothetical protein
MPKFPPLARRTLLTGMAGAALSACGDSSMKGGVQYIKEGLFGAGDLPMSRADIEKVPYASIAVRLARGPQAFVVLGSYQGQDLLWVTADRQVIATRRGRIVQTVGFDENLAHTAYLTADPLGTPLAVTATPVCRRQIDLAPSNLFDLPVESRFAYQGQEDLTILEATHQTHVWSETGAAESVDWSFTNTHWIDVETGYVWKSRQIIGPDQPVMEIVVLRPAVEPKV